MKMGLFFDSNGVREHRLRRDDAAQPVKERVTESREWASGHVGRAIDVERDAPAVGVVVALHAERVFGREQRAVNPARDHASKAEETAHVRTFAEYATQPRKGVIDAGNTPEGAMWN